MSYRTACLLALILLTGCTPAPAIPNAVAAKGTLLTKAGQPLEVAGREIGTGMVSIIFIPANPKAGEERTYATVADAQGKFDVPDGMPAGDYRVAVRQWEPYPNNDKLGARYDETNTPLKVTVTGKGELKLEVE